MARDQNTHTAAPINTLTPETDAEASLFAQGAARNETRKAERQRKKLELQEGGAASEESRAWEAEAQKLISEARPLLDMPALAPRDVILMSNTRLSNAFVMQPQQQNTAGRIFGGFLVRRALEVGFATAYMFGGSRPIFREVDEVTFQTPVDIGNLVRFESVVLFTSSSMLKNGASTIHVEVTAHVTKPEEMSSAVSNTFNFTFESAGQDGTLRRVVPTTEDEAQRIVARYHKDAEQLAEDEAAGAGVV